MKYACSALDVAFSDLVTYLQRSCKNHAALPVVSAMRSRTMYLLEYVTAESKPSMPGNKLAMFMEAVRRKTFLSWPHKEYRYILISRFLKGGISRHFNFHDLTGFLETKVTFIFVISWYRPKILLNVWLENKINWLSIVFLSHMPFKLLFTVIQNKNSQNNRSK